MVSRVSSTQQEEQTRKPVGVWQEGACALPLHVNAKACGLALATELKRCMKRKFEEMSSGSSSSGGTRRPVKSLFIDKRSIYRTSQPLTRAFARTLAVSGRLTDERAAMRVQRWWRVVRTWRPANQVQDNEPPQRGVIRSHGLNVICPLTQDTIPVGDCFRLFTSNGTTIAYTAPDLIEYFVSSGRFQCPCTREYFMRAEVARLQRLYTPPGEIDLASLRQGDRRAETVENARLLLQIFDNRHTIAQRHIEHENRCLAVENSCGEAMTEALDLCNDLDTTTMAASLHLQMNIIPEWEQMVRDYMRLDRGKCRTMLLSDREKMRRLSGQDDTDLHGLMWLIAESVEKMIRVDDETPQTQGPPPRSRTPTPVHFGIGPLPGSSSNGHQHPLFGPAPIFGDNSGGTAVPTPMAFLLRQQQGSMSLWGDGDMAGLADAIRSVLEFPLSETPSLREPAGNQSRRDPPASN